MMKINNIYSIITKINLTAVHIGIALLRISISILMFRHGFMKLIHFSEIKVGFLDLFGFGSEVSLILAIFAELLCPIFVCIGLMTRLALIPLIFTMSVAFFVVHGNDIFNVKEIALIYMITYLSFLVIGPGKISLDYLLSKKN